ncbi:M24 family metallopeptidase [Amycolatopsis sp. 195334CR]|uniref:M24 family metallopeptidase n=1 Tax=Amycolatopsis sp. 195334CR TaxID=2814588 RepID=UPI001A8D6393|nr:M24 family metallopeptidase [Amycolatopsis sp. 195334CR]MBN6040583.1 M24 family metallopeptidase [Amycolatopsis sp. 195334CR]
MDIQRDDTIEGGPRWPPPPFTAADHARRIGRTIRRAMAAGLDGVLVAPGPDLVWLTGYERLPRRLVLFILSTHRPPVLLVPDGERDGLAATAAALGVGIACWDHDPCAVAGKYLEAGGVFAVSDAIWASHAARLRQAVPGSRYGGLSGCLPHLRAVKDGGELFRLTAAGAAADAAYAELVRTPFAGRREVEVAAHLTRLLRRFGHDRVDRAFVGSGPRSARAHQGPTGRVLGPGDAVVLGVRGLMCGYGSGTTRTVVVGEPAAELRRVHEVVRAAQQAAFEAVRPGIRCGQVDRVAREVIGDAGYGDRSTHRTGHGVGLTTDEPPFLLPGSEQRLEPGMCFSLEPGIDLPGRFGVRLADIVTVTPDGGRRLTHAEHALRVVG